MTDSQLPETEHRSALSAGLDLLETPELVGLLIEEHRAAVDAVARQAPSIATIADAIVERVRAGGRIHYVGAGTSGRLGTLDAAEMPPTFGTPAGLVRAHIAGGSAALVTAVEGAEDDGDAGDAAMAENVDPDDAVIGISASGGAAFVVRAIERARKKGAYTVAIVNAASSPLGEAAEVVVYLPTGAEAIAGSTRMKAGTAQKIALNALSTAVMVRLGKVHDNLMVDVVATNRKLLDRAIRLVATIAEIEKPDASKYLERAGGRVKVAIVMARRGLDAPSAQALLAQTHGSLRQLL